MGEQEQSIIQIIATDAVNSALTSIKKKDYRRLYTFAAGCTSLICTLLYCTFKMGGYTSELKRDMNKWNGYDTSISNIRFSITEKDKVNASIHAMLFSRMALYDSCILKIAINQNTRNQMRAYYNDTLTVHTIN